MKLISLREVMEPAIRMYTASGFRIVKETLSGTYRIVDMELDFRDNVNAIL